MRSPDRSAAAVSGRIATVLVVRVGAAVVGVVNAFVLARLLGPTGKGDFYLVQLVPTTLLVLGQIGLPSAIAYFAGRGQMTGLARRSMVLALLLAAVAVLLCLLALPVLMHTVFGREATPTVLVAIAIVPFTYVFTFGNAILTGRQRVVVYGGIALGQVVLALVLFLVLIGVLGMGTNGAILAYLVYSAVAALAVAIATLSTPDEGADPTPTPISSLFGYGLRLYPASMSGYFSYRVDVYILAFLAMPAAELGLYSIAVGLAELLFFLPDSVVTVFFPHVAGSTRAEADDQAGVVTRVTIAATGLMAVPLAIAAVIAVNVLLPAYIGSLPALFVLLPGVVMLSASKTLSAYINGIGRGGIVSVTALTALVANIAANLVLIPALGIVGAATASLFSYSLGTVLQTLFCSHLTGRPAREFLVPTLADGRLIQSRIRVMWDRLRADGLSAEGHP